jgi:protein-tyrosine phosphatase
MNRLAGFLVLLVANAALVLAADHGVPNLAQVNTGIWRGGQPESGGWSYLRTLGVTNVVKLNQTSEASDAEAVRLGMRVIAVPLPLNTVQALLKEPKLAEVRAATDAIKPGTFIHCSHGQDRTGLVVGAYRVWRCGWSKSAAYAEMLRLGFHPSLVGLQRFWEHRVH